MRRANTVRRTCAKLCAQSCANPAKSLKSLRRALREIGVREIAQNCAKLLVSQGFSGAQNCLRKIAPLRGRGCAARQPRCRLHPLGFWGREVGQSVSRSFWSDRGAPGLERSNWKTSWAHYSAKGVRHA